MKNSIYLNMNELELHDRIVFEYKHGYITCEVNTNSYGYYLDTLGIRDNRSILRLIKIVNVEKFAEECYGHKLTNLTSTTFPYAQNLEGLQNIINKIRELLVYAE